jgi:hypothetical protein
MTVTRYCECEVISSVHSKIQVAFVAYVTASYRIMITAQLTRLRVQNMVQQFDLDTPIKVAVYNLSQEDTPASTSMFSDFS